MSDRSVAPWVRWLLVAAAAVLLLAACGGGTDAPETADEADTDQTDDEAADDAAADDDEAADGEDADDGAAADGEVELEVAESDLGEHVVDGEGMTLYLFTPDEQGDPTCYDDCATNWPPLVGEASAAGEGVDESLIGTVERDDGSMQVTYDGWPLYYFAADEAPGDVNGQGVQDVWFVIGPDGEMVEAAMEDGSDEAAAGDGY